MSDRSMPRLRGCASQPEDISPLDADGLIVLTIGTADTGGTMTPVGTAIAQVLSTDQLKFNISTSTGSFMNIQNLSSGEIDLGLVAGDSAYTAVYGTEDSAPTNGRPAGRCRCLFQHLQLDVPHSHRRVLCP